MKPNFHELINKIPYVSREDSRQVIALTQKYSPAALPRGWQQFHAPYDSLFYGMGIYTHNTGLRVLFNADHLIQPGKIWLHASVSLKKRVPTYDELKVVKAIFIGPDLQAIQLFPAESKHINIHKYCLHLWSCVEGDGLPDFGKEGTI
jgi:hypothetical protein